MNASVYADSSSLYSDKWVFLAHSVALEQEAAERMHELAETMAVHNNHELHELLTALATYSESHAADIKALCKTEDQNRPLPKFKAWEYFWPDAESPEIFHYANVHYLMTTEEALQTAPEVEQSAEAFYADIAINTVNPEIKQLAGQFAKEEQQHTSEIADQLSTLKVALQNDASKTLDQTDFDPPHIPE